MGKLIEGLWDCKYCKTTGIGGSKRECPGCGKPRDEDTTFYMGEAKTYVPDDVVQKINRNPDWVCNYCGSLNSDSHTECSSCGCARSGENKDYFENREEKIRKESEKYEENVRYEFEDEVIHELDDFSEEYEVPTVTTNPIKRNFTINLKPFAIVLAIIALLAGFVYLLMPKEKEVTITSTLWERSIAIEEYKTVRENDWSVPYGGRVQYTRQEISHYQEVLDHYETKTRQVAKQRYVGTEEVVTGHRDLGNGYFEEITSSRPVYETYYETETYQEPVYRSEPIYRTKYYYDIERWVYCRSVPSNGDNKSPYWGEVKLAPKEREASRSEHYWILGLDEKEKEVKVTLSYEDWQSVQVGERVRMKVSLGQGVLIRDEEKFERE